MRSRVRVLPALSLLPVLALALSCGGGSDVLEPGRLEGNTFVHEGFGLRIEFPEDWQVLLDVDQRETISRAGREVLSQGDPTGDAYRAAGPSTSRTLVAAYRYPLGESPGFNPNIVVGVENVLTQPQIQTAVDYLEALKDFLTRGGTPMVFEPILPDAALGGQSFSVLGATIQTGGPRVGQVYYVRRIEPYMLTILAAFTSPEQWNELEAVLGGVTLER